MDIDKDFLAHIFNDDIIYVINDEGNIAANSEQVKSEQQQVEQPVIKENTEKGIAAEKISQVEEEKPTYTAPKVLVLLADAPAEKEETLLNNILKAVGLTAADVDRIYEHPAKFTELKGTKLLLAFHSNYAPSSAYEINIINGIQVIYAHDLVTLESNIEHKKQLWGNLKQIKL